MASMDSNTVRTASDEDGSMKRLSPYSALLRQALLHAEEYIGGINEHRVWPADDVLAGLSAFDEPLPAAPSSPSAMLELLHRCGSPATIPQTGGRFFGFVNGGAYPAAVAARWLADVWDQNAALHVMSPIASKLESICEAWLVDLLDLPSGTAMGLVGGTSTSLICGFVAARNAVMKRQGWDVNAKGLHGAPAMRVVAGSQVHGTVIKALSIIGFGRDCIEFVDCDDHGRILAHAMPPVDATTLVVLQAGNINTGAFDPFEAVLAQTEGTGAWVHIDGAFGLWARASRSRRYLCGGMERADSWSVDAHKTLNAPYDCGLIFCRNPTSLTDALRTSGAYLQSGPERDGMLTTLDFSRRARSVDLWATLKTLGRQGVEHLVDQLCANAADMANLLEPIGFVRLNDVVFNQCLVACGSPEKTLEVVKNVQSSGECWCSGTTWQGKPAIRISICSWATTPVDVAQAAKTFARAFSQAAGS